MAHTIHTYREHLITLKQTLKTESIVMRLIQENIPRQTNVMIVHLSDYIGTMQMHRVDYAEIDKQLRRFCNEDLKPFIEGLHRLHDSIHPGITKIETVHRELSQDFAHLSRKLREVLENTHKQAKRDVEAVKKDLRFVEKQEGDEERMLRRMEQLIDRFILRDIARAERHHRPDDTPLKSDIEALQETSKKVQGFSNLICEKARLARVHLEKATTRVQQEIQGIDKLIELAKHKNPFPQLERAA
ncbi:MAG: hypothetical protein ACMXYM_05420 [Candidatus Woesearchaeota archaeon]